MKNSIQLNNSELMTCNGGGGYYPGYNEQQAIATEFMGGFFSGMFSTVWNGLAEMGGR